MNEGDMLVIRVPASSANLGPGFDSVGLALNRYLVLEAEESERWEVIPQSEELKAFPADENNYIVKVALQTAERYGKNLPPPHPGDKRHSSGPIAQCRVSLPASIWIPLGSWG